ncbi:tetratricopeptide repeat protein [Tateyamaria pelophila]|uniref:tetratricopeptide repeat protein n=1 Tax=Tateyamaria pelophila TaxID=328415 RepID=UPI001CC1905B|nr:hypothetical protein [Tateyamaria pelophila]
MFRTPSVTAVLALAIAFPTASFSAGGEDESKPQTTQTTKDCFQERQWDPEIKKYVRFSAKVNGVWDASISKCVRPDKTSHLDNGTLYDAVRELAYAGRYDEATQVMDNMPDQASDQVLTYRGFTARMLGDVALANVYYQRAIDTNPDNILARSYMGQGFVASGDKVAAIGQLREIQERGGAGTWAETSLRTAIETGQTYRY